MRGKVKLQTKAARFDGITPAYAGKSIKEESRLSETEGSPPPMRGKVH